ncbi:hypothetical protein AB1K89_09225 [Sporosarcina sp. 179-K 8C2 HS]|uniref:hypothetical protein n=1 Tax=Sporosarcina sp. 179-K 8C2 HS TaxID=3142387 RepID=UPI0039A1F1E2
MVTLLLMASKEEKQWEYYGRLLTIQPGQLFISYNSLVQLLGKGMHVAKLRLVLRKFALFGFLSEETINDMKIITITNWESYVGINEDWTTRHLTTGLPRPVPTLTSPSLIKRNNIHM